MKFILAYSGGLDTSVILKWLKESYDAEIITYAADVGQEEELEGLEAKALATGASAHHTLDLVDAFASDFIYPMMRANTLYEGQYFLGTSIARPIIAKAHVDLANKYKATHLAHGATGRGNDQCRFELAFASLAPDLKVIAPWRIQSFRERFPGRKEMIDYCTQNNIPVEASLTKPFSMDRNLLHISYEAGILEDPWFDASLPEHQSMFKLTTSPEQAPDQAEYIELEFLNGDCVALNGQAASPADILKQLNKLGAKHGIGRVDIVENRFVGMKSRGIYETPGGTILLHAHRQTESITMDRELMHLRDSIISKYATLIYNGLWFSPERKALQAFIDESQQSINGTVRLKLYKGNVITAGRKSPISLYDPEVASMEASKSDYNPDDATGFINLNALRFRVHKQTTNL